MFRFSETRCARSSRYLGIMLALPSYKMRLLNVAISRAKCLAILVASPQIFEAECRTPQQMQLANAFCRYLELAEVLPH